MRFKKTPPLKEEVNINEVDKSIFINSAKPTEVEWPRETQRKKEYLYIWLFNKGYE